MAYQGASGYSQDHQLHDLPHDNVRLLLKCSFLRRLMCMFRSNIMKTNPKTPCCIITRRALSIRPLRRMTRVVAILLPIKSHPIAYMIAMEVDPLLFPPHTTILTMVDMVVTQVQHLKIQQQHLGCRIGLHLRTPGARPALQKLGGNARYRRQPIFEDMLLVRSS